MLAGVLGFDNRPVEGEYRSMRAALEPMCPDGVSGCAERSIAMVYGADHVWTGEQSSGQPVRSVSRSIVTWDGRLDNRGDLLQRLGCMSPDTSDAAIALAAFERWGHDALARLVGDWSVAIWDDGRRTLHLARDYMGIRPLYLHTDEHAVRWSSSLGELAVRANRIHALSERFAARFLALELSTEVTPYEGIREVPAACCVSVTSRGAETTKRFWTLEPGLVRYRNRGQYEEHLRALWHECVRARLRTEGVVWAELSGGLDSSSVVCMAGSLIRNGCVNARAIQPISHVTMKSPGGDERRFIAEVEKQIGVPAHILGVEEHHNARAAETEWITPLSAHGVQLACAGHVRERGGRVILSGRMGDAVMGGSPENSPAVFDDIAAGDILQAVAKIRLWSRATQKPFVEILSDLIQRGVSARRAGLLDPPLNETQRAGIALLTSRLRPLVYEPPQFPVSAPIVRLAQRGLTSMVSSYSLQARLGVPHELRRLTYAFPFAHRPLVEYMLSIPAEELSAPGNTRSLMRRAFEGLVPARILHRTSKGYYPPALTRLTRAAVAALPVIGELEIVRRGWIDPQRLDAAIHRLVNGSGQTSAEIQRALRLEEWLAARRKRGPVATPQRKEVTINGVCIA